MIGKVTHGSGFHGLQAYLLRGKDGDSRDRVAWIAVRPFVGRRPFQP